MKRLFIALLMAMAVMFGTVASATAAVTAFGEQNGSYMATGPCVTWDGAGALNLDRKDFCPTWRWSDQMDDTGVVAEFFIGETYDGCNKLRTENGTVAYTDVEWDWENQNGVDFGGNFWGNEPCNFDKNHEGAVGADQGPMVYFFRACENVGNDRIWFRLLLRVGGSWDLQDKGHYEAAMCNGSV